ncbi:sensor domain-containing diguanylate cyclase [Halodesulfovibrio marinisediminis]|uniref:PAS domain S-box-containing protein/diguanylate cyclase (GGDEF) domain-containing protein n=1 Tax=Halodesulfovibrio marinisediminis DSM 17456 TaxID=1121457 RepID=A0A1N6HZW3_9BACT|nr:sensor domain-containing diguanylate cyclase [Halodesulfovibrio marinisediminis]SIO25332.1 PAS domain S-box-containing protein/diguanylate cyclase (GGDEF) domain-containing protein [Halodesulfovibrio marinisediminis DSM 17456]
MEPPYVKDILFSLVDGIYAVDTTRRILFWNDGAEKLTGYSSAEVLGRRCAENVLCHISSEGQVLCNNGCPLKAAIHDGSVGEAVVFLHHKQGHRLPVSLKASPLRDENGNIIGAVETFSLASSRENVLKRFEKMHKAAFLDKLTGIGNRRFGEATLENLSLQLPSTSYAVLFVDIDHFKDVNDTWGHAAGDDVLRMVANSLTSGIRKDDSAFRWGGEEFLIVLPNCAPKELANVGERLRMLVENSWLEHDGTILKVTASFGGTIANKDEDTNSVLQRADEQLYLSKGNGRNRVSIAIEQSQEEPNSKAR